MRRLTTSRCGAVIALLALTGPLASCGGYKYVTNDGWAERSRGAGEQASAGHAQTMRSLSKRASQHGSGAQGYFRPTGGASDRREAVEVATTSSRSKPRAPAPRPASRVQRRPPSRPQQPRVAQRDALGSAPGPSTGSRSTSVDQRQRAATATQQPYRVAEPEDSAAEQVVYLGYLRLRVRRRMPTMDAITATVRKAGGYIERMGSQTIVVRIPAKDFEATMATFAALGDVLARRIQALDVSAQFTDLDARLAVATEARDRLLALLETQRDVNERLRIVQEIKRLSERIEALESTLGTLHNLVAYYTITLDLVATEHQGRATSHQSPFPWVRGLVAHRITLWQGKNAVALPVARGFVRFDKAKSWHARAADTAMIRAARLTNEPEGNTAFWSAAVSYELNGRGEIKLGEGEEGAVHWSVWRNRDVQPRVWLVAVRVEGDKLLVAEGFFPTLPSWQRHKQAVFTAFKTLRLR